MTWISPDAPGPKIDLKNLLRKVGHRQPTKVDQVGRVFQWYSYCSRHFWFDPECHICVSGRWIEIDPKTGEPRRSE